MLNSSNPWPCARLLRFCKVVISFITVILNPLIHQISILSFMIFQAVTNVIKKGIFLECKAGGRRQDSS